MEEPSEDSPEELEVTNEATDSVEPEVLGSVEGDLEPELEPPLEDEGFLSEEPGGEEEEARSEEPASGTRTELDEGSTDTNFGPTHQVEKLVQIYLEGIQEDPERPFLVPIYKPEIRRISRVFIPSESFREWRKHRTDIGRVFLVHGRDHSGKLATAVQVALERAGRTAERLDFLRFQRPGPGALSLDRYLWSEHATARSRNGRQAIYLGADFLDERLTTQSSLSTNSANLEKRLDELNAFLVLTSEAQAGALAELGFEKVSAEDVDLGEVLKRHLTYYEAAGGTQRLQPEVARAARSQWSALSLLFQFPIQIRGFCELLCGLGSRARTGEIRKAAKTAAGIGRLRVREWFRGLSENQRLFSLLVYLFQGIDREDLDEIYAAAVRHLRATNMEKLEDPRAAGYEDLLEAIHARVDTTEPTDPPGPRPDSLSAEAADVDTDREERFSGETSPADENDLEGTADERDSESAPTRLAESEPERGAVGGEKRDFQQVVVFEERSAEEEVQRQVRNYSELLWSLREVFERLAERRQGRDALSYHKALGVAIARFGMVHQRRMIGLLKNLVRSDNHGVQAVAGAAMGEALATDPGFRRQGLRELAAWTRYQDPSWTFAASFAIWRAYYGVVEAATGRRGTDLDDESVDQVLSELIDLIDRIVRGVRRRNRRRSQQAYNLVRRFGGNRHQQKRRARELLEKWSRGDLLGALLAIRMVAKLDSFAASKLLVSWFSDEVGRDLPKVEFKLRLSSGTRTPLEARIEVAAALTLLDDARDRRPHPEAVVPLQRLIEPLLAIPNLDSDWLEIAMRTFRHWHQWADTRVASFQDLLRIVNRCREDSAWRLGLAIVRFWLDDSASMSVTCRLGERLLARICATDGSPVEFPGGPPGLILLDSADADAHARVGDIARRLHWVLRSQMEVEVLPLGGQGRLAGSSGALPHRLPLGSPRPRLLMPTVDAFEESPSVVVVLSEGRLLDERDALDSSWADRLIVVYVGGEEPEARPLTKAMVVRIDPRQPEALLLVLESVLRMRYRAISDSSSNDALNSLLRYLGTAHSDAAKLWDALEHKVSEVGQFHSVNDGDDPLRCVLAAIRLLTCQDIEASVARLLLWLASGDRLVRQVAASATRTLFKMVVVGEWRPPAETHGSLFSLAGPMAEDSWNGIQIALIAAVHLVEEEPWRQLLMGDSELSLASWLGPVAPLYRVELMNLARGWQEPEEGETKPSREVLAISEQVQQISTFSGCELPPLPRGRQYCVLVLDADISTNVLKRRLSQIATGILKKAPSELGDWVVCQLGRSHPLPIPEGGQMALNFRNHEGTRPRLILPLLDQLPRKYVRQVLALSTGPILDQGELLEDPWNLKVSCYFLNDQWRSSSLVRQVPQFSEPDIVPSILHYLSQASPVSQGSSTGGLQS